MDSLKLGEVKLKIKKEKDAITFTKMHGTGNDFVILQDIPKFDASLSELAQKICDRRFGVGGDGMMIAKKEENQPVEMLFYNQDGSKAHMCGNGLRCFALFVYEKEIVQETSFEVKTPAGIYEVDIFINEMGVEEVRLLMGQTNTRKQKNVELGKISGTEKLELILNEEKYSVSMMKIGVPHAVIFVDEIDEAEFMIKGPQIEKHSLFVEGTNVNFVKVINEKQVQVWTWERGAGHTLSCGTGVCASVLAAYEKGLVDGSVLVAVPGGKLQVDIEGQNLYLSGEGTFVCEGQYFLDLF